MSVLQPFYTTPCVLAPIYSLNYFILLLGRLRPHVFLSLQIFPKLPTGEHMVTDFVHLPSSLLLTWILIFLYRPHSPTINFLNKYLHQNNCKNLTPDFLLNVHFMTNFTTARRISVRKPTELYCKVWYTLMRLLFIWFYCCFCFLDTYRKNYDYIPSK